MPKVSLNPERMVAGGGGLASGFVGTLEEARYLVFDYGGKSQPRTVARFKIRPDEDDQEDDAVLPPAELAKNDGCVVAYYSVAKPTEFLPSNDGEEAIDDWESDEDGATFIAATESLWEKFRKSIQSLPKKERAEAEDAGPQLNNSTVWNEFLVKLIDAGYDADDLENMADLSELEGLHARWDRVPQRPRPGMAARTNEDGSEKKNMYLAVTEIREEEKAKGKGKAAAKGKTAPASAAKGKAASTGKAGKKAATNGGGDVAEIVSAAIVKALNADDDNQLSQEALYKVAIRAEGLAPGQKKEAMELVKSEEFYAESELFELDSEEGVVTLL